MNKFFKAAKAQFQVSGEFVMFAGLTTGTILFADCLLNVGNSFFAKAFIFVITSV